MYNKIHIYTVWTSQVALVVKNLPASAGDIEMWVWSLGWEDPLEKEMATHSSILAWRIPWTEGPGGLPSIGSQRVRHDWSNLAQQNTERGAHEREQMKDVKEKEKEWLFPCQYLLCHSSFIFALYQWDPVLHFLLKYLMIFFLYNLLKKNHAFLIKNNYTRITAESLLR